MNARKFLMFVLVGLMVLGLVALPVTAQTSNPTPTPTPPATEPLKCELVNEGWNTVVVYPYFTTNREHPHQLTTESEDQAWMGPFELPEGVKANQLLAMAAFDNHDQHNPPQENQTQEQYMLVYLSGTGEVLGESPDSKEIGLYENWTRIEYLVSIPEGTAFFKVAHSAWTGTPDITSNSLSPVCVGFRLPTTETPTPTLTLTPPLPTDTTTPTLTPPPPTDTPTWTPTPTITPTPIPWGGKIYLPIVGLGKELPPPTPEPRGDGCLLLKAPKTFSEGDTIKVTVTQDRCNGLAFVKDKGDILTDPVAASLISPEEALKATLFEQLSSSARWDPERGKFVFDKTFRIEGISGKFLMASCRFPEGDWREEYLRVEILP